VPFDWSQYLTLATELAARNDEASLRSSISRAYYYVYHLALQRAQKNDFELNLADGTHWQLWAIYSGNPEPDCQRLATIANRLRDKRVKADYKPEFPRISEEVPGVLTDVQEFADVLLRLPDRHPKPLRDLRR
jgi:hypothetical protein